MDIALGSRLVKKTNNQKRIDVCQFCHNTAELESYQATEFFHIYYLPIVPLGKKKIMNECSHCGNYTMMSYKKWEFHKTEELRFAKENFEKDNSTESAISLYDVTLQNGSIEEIVKIKSFLQHQLPNNALIKSHIEKVILLSPTSKESINHLERNMIDEPTDENGRYALGWAYYNSKEYDKAYKVLISINPIKIQRDFYYMIDLAKKVDVTSAYKILRYLTRNHEHLTRRHDVVQNMIAKCEKDLNISKENSISAEEFSKYRGKQMMIMMGCILAVIALAILYYYNT